MASAIDAPAGATVRVWMPAPPSNRHQQVRLLESRLPVPGKTTRDAKYGNTIRYCEVNGAAGGSLTFSHTYRVERREVHALADGRPASLNDEVRRRFLSANRLVPLSGKPLELLGAAPLAGDPLVVSRKLYDRVDAHVRYDKSRPGYGNGDVRWVCDSRFGNCTDFHSLFISWARAKGLPAKFEIGFPLPARRGAGKVSGYHCWAWFHTETRGWVPVDISEADKHPERKDFFFGNLDANRVALSTGRDIELSPKQDGGPLNYFVYPYIEVDGKPWPKGKTTFQGTFADLADQERR